MDLSKEIQCPNCGETMKRGSTNIGIEIIRCRFCECGLHIFLYMEAEGTVSYDPEIHHLSESEKQKAKEGKSNGNKTK